MKHLVELPLEIAKDLYKQGGAFRELAIKAYGLPILAGLPASWDEFEKNANINTRMDINDAVYIKDLHKLNTIEDAESHLSLVRLHIMRDLYRMGWKPNWLDKSPKYTIFVSGNTPCIVPNIDAQQFLTFETKETAESFLYNFRSLIEDAKDLLL